MVTNGGGCQLAAYLWVALAIGLLMAVGGPAGSADALPAVIKIGENV